MVNPTVSCVYEGAAFVKENKADFVIGIGGGSALDAAKAIALLAVNDIMEDELFLGNLGDNILPMVMINNKANVCFYIAINTSVMKNSFS
jgi:alcohol dehydrogenase class IV